MKNAFTFCFLFLTVILAQAQQEPTIKTLRILDGKKEMFLARHDEKGNQYFVKNDGMNGPLMIWAAEYDSAGHELRSIFAHANIGYSVTEKVYEAQTIKTYHFKDLAAGEDDSHASSYPGMREINSVADMLARPEIQQLLQGTRILTGIELLDSNARVIKEVGFEDNGDTSSLQIYRYNAWGKVAYFHNEWRGDYKATWDIYDEFDAQGNGLRSVRLVPDGGGWDTTEVTVYKYDAANRMIESSYSNRGKFGFKSTKEYDAKGNRVREYSYQNHPDKVTGIEEYEFDSHGNYTKKTYYDLKVSATKPKYVYRYKYEYWR